MNVRWRLGVLSLQLLILAAASVMVTGSLVAQDTWFFAGLFAVIINPQLLEPWYPRPQDVLANSILGIILFAVSPKAEAGLGWNILLVFLVIVLITALISLALGAGRQEGLGVPLARSAQTISRIGSATVIYSSIFWLSSLESFPELNTNFWTLGGAWVGIILLGSINWQRAWTTITDSPGPCTPEGLVGPSVLLLSGSQIPPKGTPVVLTDGTITTSGLVITRIRRVADEWAEIFVEDRDTCASLLRSPSIEVKESEPARHSIIGAVDTGSTDRSVSFVATRKLSVGDVVAVDQEANQVLYQISSAKIDRTKVKGGAHHIVRTEGAQLGTFDSDSGRIMRHEWVPDPGQPVLAPEAFEHDEPETPDGAFRIGSIIGTDVPVYVDLDTLCSGHLVILGMTRMGKTTFAYRLADELANHRSVAVLDQTGEYIDRRGLDEFAEEHDGQAGLSVVEPNPGQVAADRAYRCLQWLVEQASQEYRTPDEREPFPRVLLVEEAHQFIPEPAGLGFQAPGRESAYRFGTLMMQVRKFGISVIIISQRTAVVAKSALSQCENVIAFRSVDQTGLNYLESFVESEGRDLLPRLTQGEALVYGPAFSCDGAVGVEMVH